ncbi:claudin-3-like protein [Cricetulus griseus]|uniref:Claudin-3-like protein n=1 Tax=Cricetulus griseus TaxID=10029 RepID=A0A061IPP1_CRIGR|nr:claudin-3-like protein [Cricetulus griseus]
MVGMAKWIVCCGLVQEKEDGEEGKEKLNLERQNQDVKVFIKSQIDAILEKLVLIHYHHLDALDPKLPQFYVAHSLKLLTPRASLLHCWMMPIW